METQDTTPQPVVIDNNAGSVGTHLAYIRRDLDLLTKSQKENWDTMHRELVDLKGVYVNRDEFVGFQNEVETYQKTNDVTVSKLVTREEFSPIKSLMYGLVALILTAVVGAILGLVILKAK